MSEQQTAHDPALLDAVATALAESWLPQSTDSLDELMPDAREEAQVALDAISKHLQGRLHGERVLILASILNIRQEMEERRKDHEARTEEARDRIARGARPAGKRFKL